MISLVRKLKKQKKNTKLISVNTNRSFCESDVVIRFVEIAGLVDIVDVDREVNRPRGSHGICDCKRNCEGTPCLVVKSLSCRQRQLQS